MSFLFLLSSRHSYYHYSNIQTKKPLLTLLNNTFTHRKGHVCILEIGLLADYMSGALLEGRPSNLLSDYISDALPEGRPSKN